MRRGARERGGSDGEDDGVDLTPMLDVVFIMLIFFIVTSSFVKVAGVDVNRPSAVTAERKEQGNILVAITSTGKIWIDRREVDLHAVRGHIERLHAENPQGAVVIQADRKSKNRLLVEVLDAAQQAGIETVSIAAEIAD